MKKLIGSMCALGLILLSHSAQAKIATPSTTTSADAEFWKMESIPKNTTLACRDRYGSGSLAGFDHCECVGGYDWNTEKTQCVWTGGKRPITIKERILSRIIQKGHYAPASSSASSVSSCTIKGTITTTNEKIYRTQHCSGYRNFTIDTTKGEQMFCTEQQAKDAGFRKAFNCL